MKLKKSRKLILVAAISMLSGAMVVYAATLFTQSFPSQSFATPTLVQGSTCSGGNLVLDSAASTIPSYSGLPAALVFGCDSSGDTAFSSQSFVTATPIFTVPSGWSLAIVNQGALGECNTTSPPTSLTLTSGVPFSFSAVSIDYCLYSSSATTFPPFTVTWSQ